MIIFKVYRFFVMLILFVFPMISIRTNQNLFSTMFYINWRKKRLRKLIKIFDMKNKKILEL